MIQKIKLLLIATFAFVAIKSNAQASGTITITAAVTQQSNLFKSLQGGDRKAEFLSLESLFITKAKTTTCAGASAVTLSNKTDVTDLLGTPDEVLSPNLVAYYLKSGNQTCKALIGIDNSDRVLFTSINDCP
jgi:hypothetical protein